MISKFEYDKLVLKIKGEIERINILQEEQELFIINNLCDESKEAELEIAGKTFKKYKELKEEYKQELYNLHYMYNSQFAKPVPTSIKGDRK